MFEKFEKGNSISLFVFGHNEDSIVPLYSSKTNYSKSVWPFFQMGKEGEGYYGVINDISRLVGSQLNKDKHKKYVCDYCLNTQNT